jgi:hypothetical protein
MKTAYTYTVLRYVHDIATGEFVNVDLETNSVRGVLRFRSDVSWIFSERESGSA